MLKAVKGTPWQPNPEQSPDVDADRLPEPIAIEPVVAPAELPPQPGQTERLPTYRRMYIRQSDLERFGCTGGCEACGAIREGRERQGINHNEKCRARIQEALKETSQGQARLEREIQRETEYFTKVHEAEEKKRKAATEKEERSEPGGAEASEPSQPSRLPSQAAKTVEKRKPSKAEPASAARESKKPAVTVSEAASASKRKSEDQGDQELSEPRPAEDRAEAAKRKAADTEGMIETLIAGERKELSSPTCDLVDGLAEEILAETFYDDLTGKELPAEGVKAARAEEVSVIKQMGVWEVIPRPANEKVIGTRWIDINEGDGARLKLRSRLVAQELKRRAARNSQMTSLQSTWSDFFAAMPPLSSLRALFTLATTQRIPNTRGKLSPVGSGGEVCLMFLDVKKAHFWSPVRRRLLVELPPEAGEGRDKVGLLKRSLYGTRDAPSNWEKAIKDALEGLGFRQGRSNPCLYFHEEKSLQLNVHGDDFTVVGIRRAQMAGVIHQISVLNRLVTWTHEGIEMEADPRHVGLVLEQLGLEKGVSVTTPLVKVKEEDMDKTPLGTAEAALYRSIAMRIGYLSMDRPDLLRTVRELAKGLKEPQQHHWGLLKRAARYLRGAPRLVQLIPYQEHFTSINAWSDSDHAGCIKTRKSTTGTVIQLGEVTVKTAAKGQAVIAMSTGEAEYYGLISTASTALGEQAMMADWGIKLSVNIAMDASAGISIGSGEGWESSSTLTPATSGCKR
ncbi:GIP [Symbiodinium sp. CCMP2592]|nr:GIP [Symbiodinium sp. CCMP2592]